METEEEYRERIRTETPEEHEKRIRKMNTEFVNLGAILYKESINNPADS